MASDTDQDASSPSGSLDSSGDPGNAEPTDMEQGPDIEGEFQGSSGSPQKKTPNRSKDPLRPRRKKARRACFACQRAHLTCGMHLHSLVVDKSPAAKVNLTVRQEMRDHAHDASNEVWLSSARMASARKPNTFTMHLTRRFYLEHQTTTTMGTTFAILPGPPRTATILSRHRARTTLR